MTAILHWLRRHRALCAAGLGAALLTAVRLRREIATEPVAAATLFVLCVLLFIDGVNRAGGSGPPERRLAWGLMLTALLASFSPLVNDPFPQQVFLLFFLGGAVCRIAGARAAWRLFPAGAVLTLVLPFRASLMLYISYPLRMVSTVLSAGVLRLFDPRISWSQTMILLPGTDLAITDACSGIAQVEAMFLLAYLVVRHESVPTGWKPLHYLFLFPAIMLANALRIVFTAALYLRIGEAVFDEALHIALGYLQVLLALAVFFAAGRLLPQRPNTEARAS